MTQPTPEGRPLSPSERAIWLMDQASCANGVQTAHVRGPLSPALLARCLHRLQLRHPLWRVHVEGDDLRPRYVDGPLRPIPLQVVARTGPDTWQAVVEGELNRRFATDDNPLFRAILVQGPAQGELVISHHHDVGDALSIVHRFRELLEDAAVLAAGGALPEVESLPLLPALGDLLPPRGLRRLADIHHFVWGQAGVRARGLRRLALDTGVLKRPPPAERRTRLLHYALTSAETAALRRRCKEAGTTVQGALGAALLRAAAADMGLLDDAPATLGCFATVSLRDRLTRDVGTECGLLVSQATSYHRLTAARPLWELAAEVRAGLLRALAEGQPLMTFPWLGLFIPGGDDAGPRFVRRVDLAVPATCGITNVGELPIPTAYGPFLLEKLHVALGSALVAPVLLGVTTLGGALACNLLYVEPLFGRARAEALGARLLADLRGADAAQSSS